MHAMATSIGRSTSVIDIAIDISRARVRLINSYS